MQNCPTNIDPAYDTAAPPDYFCRGCQESGLHYYTLCPKNQSYDSLFQLRERAKANERKDRYQRQRDLADTFGVPPPRFKAQKVERLKFEDDALMTEDSETITKTKASPSGTFNFSSNFKKDLIESYNPKELPEIEHSPNRQTLVSNDRMDLHSANGWNNLPYGAEQYRGKIKAEYDCDIDSALPGQPNHSTVEEQFLEEMQLDQPKRNAVQPVQEYSLRVLYLINKGSLSTEIINKRARRPTALELWDRDDEERAQLKPRSQMEAQHRDSQYLCEDDILPDVPEEYRT